MANNYGYMAKIHLSIDDDGMDEALKSMDGELRNVGNQVKEVQKALTAADKAGADSTELQRAAYELLGEQLHITQEKLIALNELNEKATSAFVAGSMDTGEWARYQTDVAQTSAEVRRLESALNDMGKSLEGTSGYAEKETGIYDELNIKISALDNTLKNEKSELDEINGSLYTAQGSHLSFADAMELNRQKMAALSSISESLNEKYAELSGQAEAMKEALDLGNVTQSQYDEFQRVLIDTKAQMQDLKDKTGEYSDEATAAGNETVTFGDILKANLASEAIVKGAEEVINVISDITAALKNLVSETMEAGDAIDKQSQILGLSREAYQEWDYILSINGASVGSLTTATRTLTNAVESAQSGAEGAVSAFERLGISIDSLEGMSREELFETVIYGLQGISDEQERNAAANDLMGRSYTQLIPLMNQTAESTKELKQAAHDNGMIMSSEAVDAAVKYKDSLTTLSYTLDGLKENALSELMPPITDTLIPVAQDFLNTLNDNLPEIKQTISEFAADLSPKLEELGERLAEFAADDGLPAIIDALEWIAENGDTIVNAVKVLATVWAVDKISAFADKFKQIPGIAAKAVTSLTGVANTLNGSIGSALSSAGTAFTNLGTGAGNAMLSLKSAVSGAETASIASFAAITAAAAAAVASIVKLADELDTIADGMNKITAENQKSTDNIVSLGDTWSKISNMSGMEKYTQLNAFYDDILTKQEEWNGRYKKTIDELNILQEKKFKTADETARMKELQSQRDSLDAEYATLEGYRVNTLNMLDKYDDETIRRMEESAAEQQRIRTNANKTNSEVIDEFWKNRRETTAAEMDKYDKQLATHDIDDNEYWSKRKEYLESHRDEESEEWWKWYDEAYRYGVRTADSFLQGIIDSAGSVEALSGVFDGRSLERTAQGLDASAASVSAAGGGGGAGNTDGNYYSGDTVIQFMIDSSTLVSKTIDELADRSRRGMNPLNV